MGQLLTVLILLGFCLVFGIRLWRVNRRIAADRKKASQERADREERGRKLLTQLERVKKKHDELNAAKEAIADDPARAARVVSKMMKDKEK